MDESPADYGETWGSSGQVLGIAREQLLATCGGLHAPDDEVSSRRDEEGADYNPSLGKSAKWY